MGRSTGFVVCDHLRFVPKDERADYVKALNSLRKVAALDPVDWLPKVQAKKVRLQDATFENTTPKVAKKNCAWQLPQGASVAIYNTPEEFNRG